jgi:hypothetical protein
VNVGGTTMGGVEKVFVNVTMTLCTMMSSAVEPICTVTGPGPLPDVVVHGGPNTPPNCPSTHVQATRAAPPVSISSKWHVVRSAGNSDTEKIHELSAGTISHRSVSPAATVAHPWASKPSRTDSGSTEPLGVTAPSAQPRH